MSDFVTAVDFGRTAADYAQYRADYPELFFDWIARVATDGEAGTRNRALDIATGTGLVARGLAKRGWNVTALDRSAAMLAAARLLDRPQKLSITYVLAEAERTGLPDGAFDLVTAACCWHWLDRATVAAEVRRLLRASGRLVIAALDWHGKAGSVVAATSDLIARHNPSWPGSGLGFRFDWADDLAASGFDLVDRLEQDIDIPFSHEAWRGRIRASAGIAASLPPDDVERFDRAHAALLAARFPDEPMAVPHRLSAFAARRR